MDCQSVNQAHYIPLPKMSNTFFCEMDTSMFGRYLFTVFILALIGCDDETTRRRTRAAP